MMGFNMQKYDKVTFSSDNLTHKRIKVLLLWFEYEVYKKDIHLEHQIPMMVKLIKKIEKFEYYEVIPFFTNKLVEMVEEHKNPTTTEMVEDVKEDDKVAEEIVMEPFLIRLKTRIIKWYRLNLKRK